MKRVIVASGTGLATSELVASKIEHLLREHKVHARVEAVDIKRINSFVEDADAYVEIPAPTVKYNVPTFNGVAFLTGVNMERELENLMLALKLK